MFLPSPAARPVAATTSVAFTALALVAAALPPAEPLGIGDRLFPERGNPGYDVRAYDIGLRYSGDNSRPLEARTVIHAKVTARSALPRLNLDFAAGQVRSVRVNGSDADHRRVGEDLAVTPRRPLLPGLPVRIEVRHTSPTKGHGRGGWMRTRDGLVMANQADAAHFVFPGNDHPSDKAEFTFRVTAPKALTVVAGGRRVRKERSGAETVWTYRHAHPMATELAQVSIGRSAVLRREGPHGLPVRDVVPRQHRAALEPLLAETPKQLAWMERRAGPYPFETYGLLVADAHTGFQLETQTLSLFERNALVSRSSSSWYKESLMVHELAHQWFGNSVTPRSWDDLWLNEGHATWYEWLYADQRGGTSLKERVRAAREMSDVWREQQGPPARPHKAASEKRTGIFRDIVYDGSALVLFALREKIGGRAFARLEREWVTRHRDGNASTGDFTALAEEVSGQELTGFLHAWLYGRKTPALPAGSLR